MHPIEFHYREGKFVDRRPVVFGVRLGYRGLHLRSALLGAQLAATAALLAACSSGPGPLVSAGFAGGECIPGTLYPTVTAGVWLLYNTGTSPVRVTSVTLASSHDLAMTSSWLLPEYKSHDTWDYVGVQAGYPPIRWRTWPNRQPVPGAVIKPGQDLNLVFGLTRTGSKDGATTGPVITYTANRITYTLQPQMAFVIAAKSCRNVGA